MEDVALSQWKRGGSGVCGSEGLTRGRGGARGRWACGATVVRQV